MGSRVIDAGVDHVLDSLARESIEAVGLICRKRDAILCADRETMSNFAQSNGTYLSTPRDDRILTRTLSVAEGS